METGDGGEAFWGDLMHYEFVGGRDADFTVLFVAGEAWIDVYVDKLAVALNGENRLAASVGSPAGAGHERLHEIGIITSPPPLFA